MFYFFILFIFSFSYFFLNSNYITISHKNIIVTGASSNHGLSLLQFIYYCFANNDNVFLIVWDLGLYKTYQKLLFSILKYNKNILYRKFNYNNYPLYFNINENKGEYAWKPIIINITFHMVKKTILWLDSGCIITCKLNDIFNTINKYHCWSTNTHSNIKRWTHIGMIKYYNISKNILYKRVCNGAIVGFKWNSNISTAILHEWAECALIKQCIAPNGSSRRNHRQDQSSLSILIYKYNIFENCPNNSLSILVHKDLNNNNNNYTKIIYNKIIGLNKNYQFIKI